MSSITNGEPVHEGFLMLVVELNRILASDMWEETPVPVDRIKSRISRAIADHLNTAI